MGRTEAQKRAQRKYKSKPEVRAKNNASWRAYRKQTYKARKEAGLCVDCGEIPPKSTSHSRCQGCIDKRGKYAKSPKGKANATRYRQKLKLDVLIGYSQDPPYCACCKEDHITFLTIDHIDGNGSQHRSENPHIYAELRKAGFPDGYQVLCWNCNIAKHVLGTCPHTR